MKHNEYIQLRIVELYARRNYAAKLVMNREMEHEVKMCDAQINALTKELVTENVKPVIENPLLKIGPLVQFWVQGSNPQQLFHTDDHGIDTVLCENHLTEALVKCSNCITPWPIGA